jgi:pimeloyl-ACP methyl ester carboxylesterase
LSKAIYIFSGLGADERAFQFINFFEHKPVFINWIAPLRNESIESYAARIALKITEPNPVLIGLSFGGIMAVEVARIIKPEKVILISSVQSKNEIPFIYRLAGMLRLHRIMPAVLMRKANFITYWLFGIKSNAEKKILTAILKDTDPVFLGWAIDKILSWKNESRTRNLFKVHGTKDRLFPFYKNADVIISGGGHFMVLNKAEEVSRVLQEEIKNKEPASGRL